VRATAPFNRPGGEPVIKTNVRVADTTVVSRFDWERSAARKLVQERGGDPIANDNLDFRDGRTEPKLSKKDKRRLQALAEKERAAARRRRELAALERVVAALSRQERRESAEWIRRRVRALTSSAVSFEKVWTTRFAEQMQLGAFDRARPAPPPRNFARRAATRPSARAGTRAVAAPATATVAEAVTGLIAAHPAALTRTSAARVLAGTAPDEGFPQALRTSRWWGRCRSKSASAISAEINRLVRQGRLQRTPGGMLLVA
jgi:hypothetical protein